MTDDTPPHVRLNSMLIRNQRQEVHPSVANLAVILAHDPTLAGLVGYNDFLEEAQFLRPPPAIDPDDDPDEAPYPRAGTEADIVALQIYIQRAFDMHQLAKGTVQDAIQGNAVRNRFHPVRDWLDGLKWDGTRRIDEWLADAFGADRASPYIRAVGAKFLIAAVRRVRQPGCKFDTMPVLEGIQGAGKSRTVRRLFGEDWFTDTMPPDLTSKDSSQAVLGVWGMEFAEIEHLIRTDTETIKAFLSRPVERYRPPYGRNFQKRGRQCVFIGTTNSQDYLRDPTGNRRIWPVACTFADEDWVRDNRDQLWAEAAMRERGGEALWLMEDAHDQAKEHQTDRVIEDVWAEQVRRYLLDRRMANDTYVTTAGVLADGLRIDAARMDRKGAMRVAEILSAEGLKRRQRRVKPGGKAGWIWEFPEP